MDEIRRVAIFLEDFGLQVALMIAGFFGGLLSLRSKDNLNGWQKILSVVAGIAIANYATPIIFEYIKVNEGGKYGIAFLLGYSGLEGVQWLMQIIREKLQKK
jgi:hypothetical protein